MRARASCAERARLDQELMEIAREAEDEGDWQAAGCSSGAQWLAQVSSSDYRTAQRITRTSEALRLLPALDHALSTGALNLDQVVAAAEVATPATDAELARVAVGKAPGEIAWWRARWCRPSSPTTKRSTPGERCGWHGRVAGVSWCSAARCHSNKARSSNRRSAASPRPSARSTRRPGRCSNGSNRPRTRSSHSPTTVATAMRTSSATRRR